MKLTILFVCGICIHFLLVSCHAQEPVTINVVFRQEATYHFVEVEERTDRGESRGLEDFGSDEIPNPATWKTKTTIKKVIHTGTINGDSIFPITIDHHRTREIRGKGVYKEGTYQDSVIVRGKYSDESLKFDSVQLLPNNEFMIRDASKAKIHETLYAYNYAADFFKINNRKLKPGETFINTVSKSSGNGDNRIDTMMFTLLRVDKNIAVLSFKQDATFNYTSSHIDKHSEVHTTGEIKVDLDKQMIIQRNQEDRFFELEKMPNLKSEIESTINKVTTEHLVE